MNAAANASILIEEADVAGFVDYPIWKHILLEEASYSLVRVSRLALPILPMRKCSPLRQFSLCSAR